MVDLCRIKENNYQKPVGVVVGDFDGVREVAAIEVGSAVGCLLIGLTGELVGMTVSVQNMSLRK